MLKIHKLTKKFGDTIAVREVSLEVEPGEIFALIGPNGSGKTTIIRIIAGLLHLTTGKVYVNDRDVETEAMAAKSAIGYIPDEPAVWPAMTGEEFLNFSGALFGVDEVERKERIPDLLDIFKLRGIERGDFDDYSRGNKQKFTILAALLHQPKLLLVDEPIVGLDPVSAEIAEKQFASFTKNGGSVLLVTHTLEVAERIAHKIGILKRGELITSGTLNELKNQAKLEKKSRLDEVYKILT